MAAFNPISYAVFYLNQKGNLGTQSQCFSRRSSKPFIPKELLVDLVKTNRQLMHFAANLRPASTSGSIPDKGVSTKTLPGPHDRRTSRCALQREKTLDAADKKSTRKLARRLVHRASLPTQRNIGRLFTILDILV